MKAMIIEDERMAREQLANVLMSNFQDMDIVCMTDSVVDSVNYLRNNPQPDVIFMDVELLDGNAFEIFKRTDIRSSVIMTTAYDSYAIKAFETGSIDYLLKPISIERLRKAVGRCREITGYRKLLTIHCGHNIIPVNVDEISCLYSENKANYIMTFNKEHYLIDRTIEQLETELNPDTFIRISRGCIINRKALTGATRDNAGHLIVKLSPESPFEFSVSRSRIDLFLKWMENFA